MMDVGIRGALNLWLKALVINMLGLTWGSSKSGDDEIWQIVPEESGRGGHNNDAGGVPLNQPNSYKKVERKKQKKIKKRNWSKKGDYVAPIIIPATGQQPILSWLKFLKCWEKWLRLRLIRNWDLMCHKHNICYKRTNAMFVRRTLSTLESWARTSTVKEWSTIAFKRRSCPRASSTTIRWSSTALSLLTLMSRSLSPLKTLCQDK